MEALIVLFGTGLLTLFIGFTKKPWLVLATTFIGCAATVALLVLQAKTGKQMLNLGYEGLNFDEGSATFSILTSVLAPLFAIVGYNRFKENVHHIAEYLGLMVISSVGAMILFSFTDMFMFFIGLEILSLPIYVLAGSRKNDIRSNEASLKYFLMGSFATGIVLFGTAWIYAATQSFKLAEIVAAVNTGQADMVLLSVGILLIVAAFLFKVGAAPFHFWSPDVYDGSPTVITGFMASVVKIAAFGAFMKVLLVFRSEADMINPILLAAIALSMFVGNLSALRQTKFKRVVAYSSITHVGYTMLTLLIGYAGGLWLYMAAYGFATLGLIAVATAMNDESDEIEGWRGLYHRNPGMALVAIIAILSLAGVPPTAGFFGKWAVFSTAWSSGQWVIILIALLNSAISIYYYLKLIVSILSKNQENETAIKGNPVAYVVMALSTLVTLLLFLVSYL